jgi:dUTP pyrophosphatase
MFKVALCHPDAKCPQRKTPGSAGFDLYACENKVIPSQHRSLVSTGLKIQIPEDCYARIAPRSGLSVNEIDVGAGVVDSDYRGELKVLLCNNSTNDFHVDKGDRIAQLVIEKIYKDDFMVVEEDVLENSLRGEGGFGSTGK